MSDYPVALHGIVGSIEWDDPNDDLSIPPFEPHIPGDWRNGNSITYLEQLENPFAITGFTESDYLTMPVPDQGATPIVGAYDGNYATQGPVQAFSYEGQASGRIIDFGNNNSYDDPGGVIDGTGYLDELAGSLEHSSMPIITDADYQTNLLLGR